MKMVAKPKILCTCWAKLKLLLDTLLNWAMESTMVTVLSSSCTSDDFSSAAHLAKVSRSIFPAPLRGHSVTIFTTEGTMYVGQAFWQASRAHAASAPGGDTQASNR